SNGFAIDTFAGAHHRAKISGITTNFFVVYFVNNRPGGYDIYGNRVGTNGVVLDTSAVAICTNSAQQWYADIATSGTNYLVVWQDFRNSASSGTDIYGTRVLPDGTVQDAGGFAICTAAGSQGPPPSASRDGLVWRSDHYLAVWQDGRNSGSVYDIYGARVTSGGVVTDPNGFAISTSPNSQTGAAVAYDNSTGGTSSALVVFQSNSV